MPASAPGGPFGADAGAALLPLPEPVAAGVFLSLLHAAAMNATLTIAATTFRCRRLFLTMHVLRWLELARTLDGQNHPRVGRVRLSACRWTWPTSGMPILERPTRPRSAA